MNAFAALERVETAGAETLFCGHTHQPYVRELQGGTIRVKVEQSGNDAEERELHAMRRIVNAGSVGEPRHGITKATYVIHDDDSGVITIREVGMTAERTCRAIVEAGLPGGVLLAAEPWLRIRRTGRGCQPRV